MVEIFPVDARISVKIGGVEFLCSPMDARQQAEVLSHVQNVGGKTVADRFQQMRIALKYTLKEIKGVKMFGKPYKLRFEKSGGGVTDECLGEIAQIGQEKMLQAVVLRWLNEGIHDPKYPGVEIELPKVTRKN